MFYELIYYSKKDVNIIFFINLYHFFINDNFFYILQNIYISILIYLNMNSNRISWMIEVQIFL